MRIQIIIIALMFIYLSTTSFQCSKCHVKDMYIDGSRSWLPQRGTLQLPFVDDAGALVELYDTISDRDCNENAFRHRTNLFVKEDDNTLRRLRRCWCLCLVIQE